MKGVLIVGCGKRVQEAALPALLRLENSFQVVSLRARSEREIAVEKRAFQVERLADLDQATLDRCELVYMVVGKHSVPAVLKSLCRLDVSRVDLLIDTPVLLYKHMGHLGLIERFRSASVPEDCTSLPIFDALEGLRTSGELGAPRRVTLERSGYAYHAVAIGRHLFDAQRVRAARRRPRQDGLFERTFHFDVPGELVVIEPRDYALGRITLETESGTLSDNPNHDGAQPLEAIVEDGACTGFRVGGKRFPLTEDEASLMGAPKPTTLEPPGVTVWMEGMKRVGFLRLLERIARGDTAYPLAHAVDDTVVDYHLEKIGRYRANPLTSPQHAPARWMLRALSRIAR